VTSDSCAAERGVDLDRHCYGDFSSSLMVTTGVEIAEPCLVLNLKAAGYEGLRIHESFIAHDHLRACGSALRAFRRKVITCHDAREKRAERDFLPTDFEKQMTQTRCYTKSSRLFLARPLCKFVSN
jgi:hypothetical protein